MANSSCGLTLVKKFTYRGDASEEFSNTYWFSGSTPADSIAWKALSDAVAAIEKAVYGSVVSIIRAYGYDSPNDVDGEHAAWSYDYLGEGEAIAGTFVTTGTERLPGDAAVWVRVRTDRRTSPGGKVIYLRKYYHPAYIGTGGVDTIAATQKTALQNLGNALVAGSLPSSRKLCAMHHTEDASYVSSAGVTPCTYVTTRTLKRRGKRNPT